MDTSRYYPALVSSYPADGDSGVPVRPDITLTFSVELDPAIMNTTAINQYFILVHKSTDTPVPLELVSPSSPIRARTIVLRPAQDLVSNSEYLLIITQDLPAYTGRKSGVRRSISFTTVSQQQSIGTPLPLSPSNNAVVTGTVVVSWSAPSTYPAGTTILYRVEISEVLEFTSVIWHSEGSATSVSVPSSVLSDDVPYFWRVRAYAVDGANNVVATSDWSQTFSFYVSTSTSSSYPEPPKPVVFSIDLIGPVYDLREWPEISVFGLPLSGNVRTRFEYRGVDGWPTWNWQQLDHVVEVPPMNGAGSLVGWDWWVGENWLWANDSGASYSGSGSGIRIIPIPENPIPNMLYRLKITVDGRPVYTISFTLWFRPMYCHVDSVLLHIGDALDSTNIDQSEIAFIIYRKSLDANRHYLGWVQRVFPVTEEAVRSIDISRYYAVEKWVELQSAAEFIGRITIGSTPGLAGNRKLGDYSESSDPNAINALLRLRAQLQKESYQWLAEFSRIISAGEVARKSQLVNPRMFRTYDIGASDLSSRDWRNK